MKKEKSLISKISEISNNAPVTSPIQQENLVSKVNSLTFHTCANSLSKPQNKSFNNEKGYTLNPKSIIDALVKISDVSSVAELFSKIYSIICQNIDSDLLFDNIRIDNYAVILINEIKEISGYSYNLVWDFSHIGYDKYEEGLAILSRHDILEKESFYITKNKGIDFWKSRKIVKAVIEIDDKPIDFYSCHLGWWNDCDESFERQVNKLYEKVKNGNELSFLMGDFNNNALIRNEGYDFIKSKGLLDTYEISKKKDSGITVKEKIAGWDDNTEDLRIDMILTNKKIDVLESKVIFNDVNKDVISDHFGVEILIENI